jgi:hypothetical protein
MVNLSIFTEPAPMVVVFTKYDRLLVSKKDEFGKSLGSEKAEEVYDTCVQSLKKIVNGMKPPIPVPIFVKVSGIMSHSLYG